MRALTIAALLGAVVLLGGCTRKVYVPMESETVIQTRYVERIDTVEVEVEVPAHCSPNSRPPVWISLRESSGATPRRQSSLKAGATASTQSSMEDSTMDKT